MSEKPVGSYRASLLSIRRLRLLVRRGRGGSAPDHVAEALRHSAPEMIEAEAGEIARLLGRLVEEARQRMDEAGIEPHTRGRGSTSKLSARERDHAAKLGALLTVYGAALVHTDCFAEAETAANQGLAWCRIGGDHRQASILLRTLSTVRFCLKDPIGELQARRDSLTEARRSGCDVEIVEALSALCSLLANRKLVDEAGELNDEALELARTKLSDEERRRIYPLLLLDTARIRHRTDPAKWIRTLREALRWSDGEANPLERGILFGNLGIMYLHLRQYRQAIECQHEAVRLAEAGDSTLSRSWGYFRLAEAHWALGEEELAEEMLDRAEALAQAVHAIRPGIVMKRAQIRAAAGLLDEAADLCGRIVVGVEGASVGHAIHALRTLADVEERRENVDVAERHWRAAISMARGEYEEQMPGAAIRLAELLHRLGRTEEAAALLDDVEQLNMINDDARVQLLRLRGTIAEGRGELRGALDYERDAFAYEKMLLERRAETSLRNARIVAETDLLEREADLERERRRRVERELAEAVVTLGDRKRLVEMVEERLRRVLENAGAGQERTVLRVVRETLGELRSQASPAGSPLRYLNGIDDEFYRRLRERWPDLTPKQERLCGLVRAGLASKEIAAVLELGPEGLKAQRKRLRRKLGLASDDGLETVLAGL